MKYTGFAILDSDHNIVPIDYDNPDERAKWITQRTSMDSKRVAVDYVNDIKISTVFLGSDYGDGPGQSIWFETMPFDPEGGPWDQVDYHTSTWDEAKKGHQMFVDAIKEGLTPDELNERINDARI